MDDSEHNIGENGNQCMFSDEESQALCNNHEDAAFDYCEHSDKAPTPAEKADESVAATQATGGANGLHGYLPFIPRQGERFFTNGQGAPITLSRIGDGEGIKCFMNEDSVKARRKVDKKKRKKAEGWTKSNDMAGHVDFNEVDEALLNFIGVEGHDNSSALSQKKKLRKRLKSKSCSKSDRQLLLNGNGSTPSTTTSDSDPEDNTHNSNKVAPSNSAGRMNGMTSTSGAGNPKHNELASSSDNYFSGANSVDTAKRLYSSDNDITPQPQSDGEFKEVHRRKKANHKQQTTLIDKSKPPMNSRPFRRSKPEVKSSAMSANQPKVTAASDTTMDLSLNAFPSLESQYWENRNVGGDTKSSVHTESTGTSVLTESATDDDRDSITSQSTNSNRASWAWIAARPTTLNHISSNTEVTITTATCMQSPQTTDANPSPASPTVDITHEKCIHSQILPDSTMTRSATAASGIEFGTVTTSSDLKADQQVHNILSQSFTEGQTMFKLGGQLRNTAKCAKSPTVDNANHCSLGKQRPKAKAKGVEFLDECPGQTYPSINIVFGFDNKELAQVNHADSSVPVPISSPPISQDNPATESCITVANSDETNALPQTNDVLPHILSACSTTPSNQSWISTSKQDCNGNFDLVNAVSMLRREWNGILKLRDKFGNEVVKFSEELLSD